MSATVQARSKRASIRSHCLTVFASAVGPPSWPQAGHAAAQSFSAARLGEGDPLGGIGQVNDDGPHLRCRIVKDA